VDPLASTAALLGDPARASILLSLMDGQALPAGELARIANIAPQTASGHLARLLEGRLLRVEIQGRHRYYRLSGPRVAEALESLLVLAHRPHPRSPHPTPAQPGTLAYARTCYAHIAGRLGVQIAQAFEQQSLLTPARGKTLRITSAGTAWLENLGIHLPSTPNARVTAARRCLDWTERRHHLAGPLGCALYRRLRELEWLVPLCDTRALRLTLRGRRGLHDTLHLSID
jgi:DNA-binding transcriptional ArsR family regulator